MLLAVHRLAPHTRRTRLALVLLVIVLVALLTAVQLVVSRPQKSDAAVVVTCGQSLTASVTLTANLGPCPGYGLIASKSGITINLGGHTITGTSAFTSAAGVAVGGVSSVTITNGTIQNFGSGVQLSNSNTSKATNLRLTGNQSGIDVFGGASDTVSGNVVWSNSGLGIVVCCGGSKHVLTGNTVQSNPIGIQIGDATTTISAVTVSSNKITSNTTDGIHLYPSATGTILTNNLVNSNTSNGIRSEDVTAKFTTNTADYNGGYGLVVAPGSLDGGGNLGQNNGNARQCANVVCLPV